MDNQKSGRRKKFSKAIKAALLGALLFCGINLFVMFGDNYMGWTKGAGISFPGLVIAILPQLVRQVVGFDDPYKESIFNGHGFELLVNSFFGVVAFFIAGVFWQFCEIGEDENKT